MPSFDLATGYVTFKGDFAQYEADIAKAEEKLESLKKADMTGQFKMAAYAAKGVNDQLEKAQKNARRMVDEIKYGKLGLLMRDASAGFQRFQERMQAFGKFGVGVGAAAVGAGAIASPLAADTLAGSMKLLSVTIGRDFVPLIKELSHTIQTAARWWDNLDSKIKENVVTTTKLVAVAGAAALALSAITKGLMFLANNPLVAIGGAAVGVGAAIANVDQNKNVEEAQRKIFSTTEKQALNSDMGMRLSLLKPEVAKQEALQYMKEREMGANAAKRAYDEIAGNSFLSGASRITSALGLPSREESARENMVEQGQKFEEAKFLANKFGGANLKERGKMPEDKKKDDMLLGSVGPSSYSSLQDFYRQMNLATTGTSQLEAEIQKRQAEADQKFRDAQLKVLGEIATNTKKAS